jgi:hypothetical protein
LQEAAQGLGHHFLYANLAEAQSKQDVLDLIGAQFTLPSHFGTTAIRRRDGYSEPRSITPTPTRSISPSGSARKG